MRAPVAGTLISSAKSILRDRSEIGCTSLIRWQDHLFLYRQLKNSSLPATSATFPPVLKACANLELFDHGESIHADVIKMGFASYSSTCNTIMSLYIKRGATYCALNLFGEMPQRDSISWNVIIHGLSSCGDSEAGMGFFRQARTLGFEPNVATLVLAIQASWKLNDVDEGLKLHDLVLKNGFLADVSVQNSMISMYAKVGDIDSARRVFDEITEKDVISWSSLIGGYVQNGQAVLALQLFRDMSSECDMDELTAASVLQACSFAEDVHQGSSFHCHLIRKGIEHDLFVQNSLIDMYSKCNDVDSARNIFDMMSDRNSVSWNTMVSGLLRNERHQEAVALFNSMKKGGVLIDEVALVNLMQSCKKLNQVIWCKCIHSMIIKKEFASSTIVLNNLMDAYVKCNGVELAAKLFNRMESRNVISWSIIIAGFARNGQPDKAIANFIQMWLAGEQLNPVAMLSVLEACAVAAELKLSKSAHGIVLRNQFASDLSIGTAILDMYAKCGDVSSARKVFESTVEKNVTTWNAMIGAFGMNGCPRASLVVFSEMVSQNVKPNEVTILAVLSACSHGGLVEEGLSIFKSMTSDPSLRATVEHYSCVVDMLGRAGDLEGALEVIERMPEAGPAAWSSLLSACRSRGNCKVGQNAAARILELEPSNPAGYLLTSSMYAKDGSVDEMARTRLLLRKKGVKVIGGYSLVRIDGKAHKFVSWDGSHPQSKEVYSMIEFLHNCMRLSDKNDFL
ncbi:pentatricopeptide repeat-containing protein At2g17210-like [Zingiber officinale]|uniref:Chlororespiratory reduction 21 n=1 Tax=Zingiber officinale TaxID=94328 RepID=A0A8J5LMZ8_ZINOF|nr:pentatricopeptide repeat-containing protein At2g17210-like [Zingiber officinale]KAG6519289.1 hypothetical protein ZIOFF_022782 [Zingiber officinale]